MALNVALGEPELAAARALHSPLSGEVAARLCVIAGLKRRLAEERAALSDILEHAARQREHASRLRVRIAGLGRLAWRVP